MIFEISDLVNTNRGHLISEIVEKANKWHSELSSMSRIDDVFFHDKIDTYAVKYDALPIADKHDNSSPIIYSKIIEPEEYQRVLEIKPDDTDAQILRKIKGHLMMHFRHREHLAASVFNHCTSTNFTFNGKVYDNTAIDGLPCACSEHDNFGTNHLTYDNLLWAKETIERRWDAKGYNLQLMPDTLMVSAYIRDWDTANTILRYPEFKNWKFIAWPYLLPGVWSIWDSAYTANSFGPIWVDRTKLQLSARYNYLTGNADLIFRQRFAPGVVDWRGLFVNIPEWEVRR